MNAIGIPAEQDFGPILRPENPTGARNILGYDNFQTSNKAKEQIKYGNHWEQFDTEPVQDLRFNGGANGGHGHNPYNTHLFNAQRPAAINYHHNPVQYNS